MATDFTIQTLELDFARELVEMIKFSDWRACGESGLTYSVGHVCGPDSVPVGTVEWVLEVLKDRGVDYKPIKMLQPYLDMFCGRKVFYGRREAIPKNWFYKEAGKLKGEIGFRMFGVADLADTEYLISEPVDFKSEYRVFVYEGEIVGLKHYLGDCWEFPDRHTVARMVEEFKGQPVAYTLDVGVVDGGTLLVEINDFFSCGLYGWSNQAYPYMLRDRFKQIIGG